MALRFLKRETNDRASRGNAIRILVSAGRGRFWLKRSAVAEILGVQEKL